MNEFNTKEIGFFMILVKLSHKKIIYDISKALSQKKFYKFHSKELHGEMSVKLYKYPSAVRGYQYYHNLWQPVVGEELDCMHEIDNPFDLFTIAIKKTTRETIGHLPMENLKVNVSNGPWSKVYRCSHFFTILCLAISSKWT